MAEVRGDENLLEPREPRVQALETSGPEGDEKTKRGGGVLGQLKGR